MQKHVASCSHAQGGAHSYLLALVFDCTLSIRSLVHISSEPQSLVKGTWNDRKVVLNILNFWHFLQFMDLRGIKQTFIQIESLHSFEASACCWENITCVYVREVAWKTVIMTRPGAPCYFKWVKIAILFEVLHRPLLFSCWSRPDSDASLTKNSQALAENWSSTGFTFAFFCSISTFKLRELTKSGASCGRQTDDAADLVKHYKFTSPEVLSGHGTKKTVWTEPLTLLLFTWT